MALSKQISITAYGKELVFTNAYIRVAKIIADKNSAHAEVDTLSQQNGEQIVRTTYPFVPDLNGENFIAQAYFHLKTLAEFADATDC